MHDRRQPPGVPTVTRTTLVLEPIETPRVVRRRAHTHERRPERRSIALAARRALGSLALFDRGTSLRRDADVGRAPRRDSSSWPKRLGSIRSPASPRASASPPSNVDHRARVPGPPVRMKELNSRATGDSDNRQQLECCKIQLFSVKENCVCNWGVSLSLIPVSHLGRGAPMFSATSTPAGARSPAGDLAPCRARAERDPPLARGAAAPTAW